MTVSLKTCWQTVSEYEDIRHEKIDGIAKITINRPERRNAFRPETVIEMQKAFEASREDPEVGVIILTGEGKEAFCAGGDQKIRGDSGYVGGDGVHRLNILDFQRQIRTCPKPVIAMVAGYAVGGGHVLHMVCDLTIAADNAVFGQTGPKVGSFDGGFGASYMARIVGQKKARERLAKTAIDLHGSGVRPIIRLIYQGKNLLCSYIAGRCGKVLLINQVLSVDPFLSDRLICSAIDQLWWTICRE